MRRSAHRTPRAGAHGRGRADGITDLVADAGIDRPGALGRALERPQGVEGVVWVDVASTVQRGGQTRQGRARLDVDETTPRYGGVRYWWLCPACGGRVTTLYLPPGVSAPACRRCYRLTYKTRQAHDKRDDRYRRLPPWERLALLHTMTMADRDPPNIHSVPRAQWAREISRILAGTDELTRLVNSLKAPRHSLDYYERRANR